MKIFYPHKNASLPELNTVLLVFHEWKLPKTPSRGWRGLRRYMRWFWANPRSADYMAELAETLFANTEGMTGVTLDAVASQPAADVLDKRDRGWLRNLYKVDLFNLNTWDAELIDRLKNGTYDALVFLYPDPLGLGWGNIENNLQTFQLARIFILNGRRRFFELDRQARLSIKLRRWWVYNPWLEIFLGVWVAVAAFFCGLFDLIRKPFMAGRREM